jgi:hypothetical protein
MKKARGRRLRFQNGRKTVKLRKVHAQALAVPQTKVNENAGG